MALVVALALVAASAAPLRADDYSDQDSHPLRVVYYAVYPVAKMAEWLVFRPLEFLGRMVTPDEEGQRERAIECRSIARRPHRECG